jgi:hypothetical protein
MSNPFYNGLIVITTRTWNVLEKDVFSIMKEPLLSLV